MDHTVACYMFQGQYYHGDTVSLADYTMACYLFQGQYYQEGDIVSLVDHDGGVFYAQIRGFMCDQYNEKSAVITWLLPTQNSPADKFDASTYILGK